MNIFIVLILLSSILPLAFADESDNASNNVQIDAETQQQTEIMKNGLGQFFLILSNWTYHESSSHSCRIRIVNTRSPVC